MANGNVTSRTAAVLLMKDSADGVADTGVVTSGVFNGQNLQPCYIPSAAQILPAGSVPLTALAQGGAVSTNVLAWNGTAWAPSAAAAGTVTSVGLTVPSILSVAGSPVTTAGTLAVTLATQTANTVWAGATSGGAAVPTFRALVANDLPASFNAISTPSISINPGSGTVSWASSSVLASPVNGTLQVATSTGTFGKLLLGAAGVTTGIQLSASNGLLTVQDGTGATAKLTATTISGTAISGSTSGAFNTGGSNGLGVQIGSTATGAYLARVSIANAVQAQDANTGLLPGYVLCGLPTVAKATTYTLTFADMDVHFVNSGATTFTLPTAAQGLIYHFTCTSANNLVVTAGSTILNGSGASNTGKTSITAAGATTGRGTNFSVVCTDGTNWWVRSLDGVVTYA